MSDLQKTQAEWTRYLGRELGSTMLAPLRELRELQDKFSRDRTQVVVLLDYSSFVDAEGATFAGVDPGNNTDEEGRVWVRLTGTAGARVVSVYKAAGGGGGNLVAQAAAVADGNTATLTAQNSSGLTGTWAVPATAANTSGDELQLLLVVDYPQRLKTVYLEDGTIENDKRSRDLLAAAYKRVEAAIKAAKAEIVAAMEEWGRDRGNDFHGAAETTLASDRADRDTSGNVVRKRGGLLVLADDDMEDETTGGEQFVVKTVPSAGAGVFDANNDLQATIAAHTPQEKCPPLVLHFECTDDTIGKEKFSVRYAFSNPDDDRVVPPQTLQIEKDWSGPHGVGPLKMVRTLTKTGDGSDNIFTAASNAVVTGPTSRNSDDGIYYWELVANGSNWDISFYSSSTRDAFYLVAKATNVPASTAFVATEQRSSGLTISWSTNATPSATNGTLNINPAKKSNSAKGVPDKATVTITVAASPGLYQTLLAEELPAGGQLHSTTAGSETIPDAYAKQGTFVPFLVTDN